MYSDIRILVALTCIIEDEGPRNFDSHLEMRVFWIEKNAFCLPTSHHWFLTCREFGTL